MLLPTNFVTRGKKKKLLAAAPTKGAMKNVTRRDARTMQPCMRHRIRGDKTAATTVGRAEQNPKADENRISPMIASPQIIQPPTENSHFGISGNPAHHVADARYSDVPPRKHARVVGLAHEPRGRKGEWGAEGRAPRCQCAILRSDFRPWRGRALELVGRGAQTRSSDDLSRNRTPPHKPVRGGAEENMRRSVVASSVLGWRWTGWERSPSSLVDRMNHEHAAGPGGSHGSTCVRTYECDRPERCWSWIGLGATCRR